MAGFFQAMQRPSVDGLNTYLICKAVREAGFKVALSGLGGDEAVGGYSHFRLLRYLPMLRAMDAVPLPVGRRGRQARRRAGPGREGEGQAAAGQRRPAQRRGPCSAAAGAVPGVAGERPDRGREPTGWPGARTRRPGQPDAHLDSFAAMAAAEVAIYLQAMLLPDADTFSMASSVELRVPFVDGHVFAAALDNARRPESRAGQGGDRRGAGRSLPQGPRDAAEARFQPAHGHGG